MGGRAADIAVSEGNSRMNGHDYLLLDNEKDAGKQEQHDIERPPKQPEGTVSDPDQYTDASRNKPTGAAGNAPTVDRDNGARLTSRRWTTFTTRRVEVQIGRPRRRDGPAAMINWRQGINLPTRAPARSGRVRHESREQVVAASVTAFRTAGFTGFERNAAM